MYFLMRKIIYAGALEFFDIRYYNKDIKRQDRNIELKKKSKVKAVK